MLTIKIGILTNYRVSSEIPFVDYMSTFKSNFKPKLISKLGEGGQAKVFKCNFHGNDVAMKYVPLNKFKDGYQYRDRSYGCDEFYFQEKF